MASIDELIANSAKTDPKMWEAFSNIPRAYYEGQDQAYKQKMRNVFSDENGGLPRDDKGNVDFQKAYERLVTVGGAPAIDAAGSLATSGLTQDRIRYAPQASETLANADQPPAAAPGGFPPSANRSGSAIVAPPLARGGVVPPQGQPQPAPPAQGAPQQGGDRPGSLMGFLANWGVPDELAGSEMNIHGGKLSAALGRRIDPNQPLDMNDPKIRVILGDWVRSRGGRNGAPSAPNVGPAPTPAGYPTQQQPVVSPATGRNSVSIDPTQRAAMGVPQPQAAPQSYEGLVQAGPAGPQPVQMQPGPPPAQAQAQAQPAPQMQPQGQPPQGQPQAPASAPVAGDDPQTANLRRAAATLEKVRASGRLLPEADKAYEAKLQSIYKQIEQRTAPTTEMKNFQQSQADPRFDQRSQDNAAAEAFAKGDAESRVKQYQGIVAAGVKGLQEIPQLRMLQNEMEKPNFYSGVGERYNYLYKQLKSAVGIDPNASVPQDILRKAAASNIISQLSAFNGLGQIRVAEIKLTQAAANAPETSVPANKFLAETAIRTHQRNADIADMAQRYNDGHLDAGFDRQVLDYEKSHPLYSRAEIADWSKVIGEDASRPQSAPGRSASAGGAQQPMQFSSQTDPRRAGAKSGDIITDENGRKFRVR
jgi:hypothetical protein